MNVTLPTDAAARKDIPIVAGCLDYFPAALAAVAALSKKGNDQHNAGQPLHWARGKSMDHADCIVRHLMDRGTVDTDGVRHSAKVAWRALALLQEELEAAGAPLARGARLPAPPAPTVQMRDPYFTHLEEPELPITDPAAVFADTAGGWTLNRGKFPDGLDRLAPVLVRYVNGEQEDRPYPARGFDWTVGTDGYDIRWWRPA